MIQEYRNKKGYTQENVARIIEITLNSYQKIEYGESLPNIITGLKIAKLFEVDPYILFKVNQ